MTRKRYAVDVVFKRRDIRDIQTYPMWVLADTVSRKILEASDSFKVLILVVISKYDIDTVSFDKVSGREEVLDVLRRNGIPHIENANTPEEEYVTY